MGPSWVESPGLGQGGRTISPGAGSGPEPPTQRPAAGCRPGAPAASVRKTLSQLFTRMPSAAPALVVHTAPPLAVQTPALPLVSTPSQSPHLRAPGSEAVSLLLGSAAGILSWNSDWAGQTAQPFPVAALRLWGAGTDRRPRTSCSGDGLSPLETPSPPPGTVRVGRSGGRGILHCPGSPPGPACSSSSLEALSSGSGAPKLEGMSQTSPRGHGSLARVWCTVLMGSGSGSRLLDSSWQRFGGARVGGLGLFLTGPGDQACCPRPGQ